MKEFLYQVLVQIPEPVYFSLFLIIGKNIKEKRLLLIGIMLVQYLLLMHIFPYNIWFQLIYTFMSFVNLKVLYKEKAQVTDIFLFATASIILIIASAFCYGIIYITIKKYIWVLITNRILIFVILYFGRNKIRSMYKKFCSLWNRHNNPKKIRSLTLRNISIITFNLMFWLINLGVAIGLIFRQ